MKNFETESRETRLTRLLDEVEKVSQELPSREGQELSELIKRGKKTMAVLDGIEALNDNFDGNDLLRLELVGTLSRLSDVCIDWFPSKEADSLSEELFNPIFNNETPELRPETSSGLHRFFQFVRAVECCAKALRLGNTKNQKSRDKAWVSVIEAFTYYVEIYNGKQLPTVDFSKLGKAGAAKRHAPVAKLRAWAIEKYKEGNWPSANRAAFELKAQVMEYGRTIGAQPMSEQNAQRTIAGWFRKSD